MLSPGAVAQKLRLEAHRHTTPLNKVQYPGNAERFGQRNFAQYVSQLEIDEDPLSLVA